MTETNLAEIFGGPTKVKVKVIFFTMKQDLLKFLRNVPENPFPFVDVEGFRSASH